MRYKLSLQQSDLGICPANASILELVPRDGKGVGSGGIEEIGNSCKDSSEIRLGCTNPANPNLCFLLHSTSSGEAKVPGREDGIIDNEGLGPQMKGHGAVICNSF